MEHAYVKQMAMLTCWLQQIAKYSGPQPIVQEAHANRMDITGINFHRKYHAPTLFSPILIIPAAKRV